MKIKELKSIANKIAKCEMILRTSNNPIEKHRAEEEIIMLAGKVESFEDIEKIDEIVQEIISKI